MVDDAVVLGTPTAKQTSVAPEAQVLMGSATAVVAAGQSCEFVVLCGISEHLVRSRLGGFTYT